MKDALSAGYLPENMGGNGIDASHYMLADFICSRYADPHLSHRESVSLHSLVVALSLLFGQGHLRVPAAAIADELETLSAWTGEMESSQIVSLAEKLGDPAVTIRENPAVFAHESALQPEMAGSVKSPFVVTGGSYVTTQKLYMLEKKFTESFRAFPGKGMTLSAAGKQSLPEAAEKAVSRMEKESGIVLEKKQRQAVIASFGNNLTVIAGGPGTGKSTVISFLISAHLEADPLLAGHIAVAAPTGRAAKRLESLTEKLSAEGMIEKPQTLHRLLGIGYRSAERETPLPHRMVIIDEASMLDMEIMKTLLSSLRSGCRLVLVGDPDQLPAVGTGTLFADITENMEDKNHLLNSCFVRLDAVKRSEGEIPLFAESLRKGQLPELKQEKNIPKQVIIQKPGWDRVFSWAVEKYERLDRAFREGGDDSVFSCLSSFILLSPSNSGQLGVENLNEKLMSHFSGGKKRVAPGMPLMIVKNDYRNNLYNGDRGIIASGSSGLYAFFLDSSGIGRKIPLAMIKNWEISYAQTVHKSQGNEFDSVAIAVEKTAVRILTREILYTAVTRARKEVVIFADTDVLESAVKRKVQRYSGIGESMTAV